jgi:hypothetical protein
MGASNNTLLWVLAAVAIAYLFLRPAGRRGSHGYTGAAPYAVPVPAPWSSSNGGWGHSWSHGGGGHHGNGGHSHH